MRKATKKHVARREKVIGAAAQVFADRGFHGASTADIAEKIGIQQGSLYYYFDSKETALQEVCELGMRIYVDAINQVAQSDGGIDDKMSLLVSNHLNALDGALPYIRTYLYERRALSDERSQTLNQMVAHYEDTLEKIIADGVGNGELPERLNCCLASLYVMSMFNTVAVQRDRRGDVDIDQLIEGITAMVIGGLHSARWTA
jgi:AcrR family transcriptional regulator